MNPQELAKLVARDLPCCAPEIRLSFVAQNELAAGNEGQAFLVALRQELGADLHRLLLEAVAAAGNTAARLCGLDNPERECPACGDDGPHSEAAFQHPGEGYLVCRRCAEVFR